MVWAFHTKANAKRKEAHQTCQACLIEIRLAGSKDLEKQYPKTIPCELHGRPDLWPENELAWDLWQMSGYQVNVFSTKDPKKPVIELNYASLIPLVALYVEERRRQQETLEKIVLCHRIMQSKGVFDYFS